MQTPPQKDANHALDGSLYEGRTAVFIHQNELIWNFLQFVTWLQGAAVATAYLVRQPGNWLGEVVLIVAAIATGLVWRLSVIYQNDREKSRKFLDDFARIQLGSPGDNPERSQLLKSALMEHDPPRVVGGNFTRGFLYLAAIILDIFLIFLFRCYPTLLPTGDSNG